MPINLDTPSWLSTLQANDKPVYLNREGTIRTGKSLQGRLVSIAESLGIFKNYATSYRGRETMRNRDAHDAVWRFVNLEYGSAVGSRTQASMERQGYSRAISYSYAGRLRGCDARDPLRAIVGRELRSILDTARGVDQRQRIKLELARQQDVAPVLSDEEIAAQKQRWAIWTGAIPGDTEVVQGDAEVRSVAEVSETSTPELKVDPELQVDVNRSKPSQVSSELGRTIIAGNKEMLQRVFGSKTQLKQVAQELDYNPEAIASRRHYIQGKLGKRLETDPQARAGRLSRNEMHELVREVFDKALGKGTVAAGIRGTILHTSKMKSVLDENNPGQVDDALKLSKDKIKAGVSDRQHLKQLMAERVGVQGQEVYAYAERIKYVEHLAIEQATALVQGSKVELSATEVDDVLIQSLRKSLEIEPYKAWMKGNIDKNLRTLKPDLYESKTSLVDDHEKIVDEGSHVSTANESVASPLESAAVATPPPDSRQSQDSLPKPQRYKGTDYFDSSDREIKRLGIAVRNHQSAKQVVADDAYLAASMPEDHSGSELTSARREYIKTTLLRHVAEHERTNPNTPLGAADLHHMMIPITARALQVQSGRELQAKVLYKNVAKHLGRKDAVFGNEMEKLRRDARSKASAKVSLFSFVQGAARKADIAIDANSPVLRELRSQIKDMAEAYVNKHRKPLTESHLEQFVQVVLRGYSLADRLGHAPPAQQSHWQGYSVAERMGLVR